MYQEICASTLTWTGFEYENQKFTNVFLDDFILENGQIMNMNIFIANLLELL